MERGLGSRRGHSLHPWEGVCSWTWALVGETWEQLLAAGQLPQGTFGVD